MFYYARIIFIASQTDKIRFTAALYGREGSLISSQPLAPSLLGRRDAIGRLSAICVKRSRARALANDPISGLSCAGCIARVSGLGQKGEARICLAIVQDLSISFIQPPARIDAAARLRTPVAALPYAPRCCIELIAFLLKMADFCIQSLLIMPRLYVIVCVCFFFAFLGAKPMQQLPGM